LLNSQKTNNDIINDLQEYQITILFEWDTDEMTDYTRVDKKVAAMGLTKRQTEILTCRMECGGASKTASALSVTDLPMPLLHLT